MNPLPGGAITFLLTDVEQSTRLWEESPEQMRAALARHDALAKECIARHGGALVKERGEGDSLFATFTRAGEAAAAAAALQNALLAEAWPRDTPLLVRMALHTGEVECRDGDYYGATVNRCARIRAIARGGQILVSQATAEMVRDELPSGVTLRDLGMHRLKDLQRPERLADLLHPDWPSDFPPLRSLEVYKHNLPRQLTSFIGREKEIEKVRALLDKTRLLTLTGPGGSGKTRLALQVAAELADACEEGVWLVELAPLPEKAAPDEIAKAIAAALRVKEQAGQDTLTTLREDLTAKSLLLLLDNCEHVEQACMRVVHALLLGCPGLRVLATSRHHLSVPGETVCPIAALSLPPKDAPLTPVNAPEYESLHLFAERAAAALPSFALTSANLGHVAQICRRLDGIPLAIELAAARVSALSAKQIAERLDHAFRFLKADGCIVERHRTLLAAIEWSYALLNDAEKALLRRLSVFVGGWTLEACEAVCAGGGVDHWDVVDLLTRLVHTSLVTMQDGKETDCAEAQAEGTRDAEEPSCRYSLLETLRQFGQEKLEEFGETAQARARHLEYYLALTEQAEPELTGSHQACWLERLETDHDNLRAALKWATDGETRLRLACALWRFWAMHSYFSEGRGWLNGALAHSPQILVSLRAKALNALGYLATRQGDHTEARVSLEQSLFLRQQENDQAGMAETLNNLANVACAQGEQEEARDLFDRSLQLWQKAGSQRGIANVLNNLGILLINLEDYAGARSHFERSLTLYRECDEQANIAASLGNLGVACYHLQDYAQARRYYEEGLALAQKVGDRWGTAIKLYNLGDVAHKQGDFTDAFHFLRDCLELQVMIGDKNRCAETLSMYAEVAWDAGRGEEAVTLFGAAQTLCRFRAGTVSCITPQQSTHILEAAQSALTPTAYHALWMRGTVMTEQEVLSYILASN